MASASEKPKPTTIGGYTIGHLLKRAEELVAEKTKGTTILDEEAVDRMPKFDMGGKSHNDWVMVFCTCSLLAVLFAMIQCVDLFCLCPITPYIYIYIHAL
jgi:hypothetical protein